MKSALLLVAVNLSAKENAKNRRNLIGSNDCFESNLPVPSRGGKVRNRRIAVAPPASSITWHGPRLVSVHKL
jgi:hypothetical protein